jgi:hypothetical protein
MSEETDIIHYRIDRSRPAVRHERSSFNRSHGHKLTCNAGLIIPIFLDEVLPGDTFNLRYKSNYEHEKEERKQYNPNQEEDQNNHKDYQQQPYNHVEGVSTTLERADESYYWNTLKDTHGGDVDSAFKFNSGSTPGHMHPFSVNSSISFS